MKKTFLQYIIIFFMATTPWMLTGCAPSAEFLMKKNEDDAFYATDARLRLVVNSTPTELSIPGRVDPSRIICTEPSPDVATTLATSLGFGINALGYGNASLTKAAAEGLVQLAERTASIQLLRDKMYQSCLAYQNGAISGTTYSLIMNKLDDTIITMMMGEISGGAFGRKLAAMGSNASSDVDLTMISLPKYADDIVEVEKDISEKQEEIEGLEKGLKEAKSSGASDNEIENKEGELKTARSEYEEQLKDLKNLAKAISKSTAGIKEIKAGGELNKDPNVLIAMELSRMHDNFISDASIDQVITSCLVDLGQKPDKTDTTESYGNGNLAERTARAIASSTKLTKFCGEHLNEIIDKARKENQKYRMSKIKSAQQSNEAQLEATKTENNKVKLRLVEKAEKLCQNQNNSLQCVKDLLSKLF